MNQPQAFDDLDAMSLDDQFDSDDSFEASGDAMDGADEFDGANFDDDAFSDAGDDFDAMSADSFDNGDALDAGDAWDGAADGFDDASWQAFENDVADALDSGDADEFLSRIIGGLSNAARAATRVIRPVAQAAGRAQPYARAVAQAAGGASQMGQAASQIAGLLGSPAWAQRFGQAGQFAGRVGQMANTVATNAGRVQTAGNSIAALLGQLMGQGFDDFDAFDALADEYEDGVDEALPAIVGLAARGLARGLGHRNVGQMGHAARRALVRGVATAARTLVSRHGPQGARALGRLATRAGTAARRQARNPQQLVHRVRSGLPRVAQRVAQQGQVVRQLATPLSQTAPASQAPGMRPRMGTAGPGAPRASHLRPVCQCGRGYSGHDRVLRFRGPVDVVIRQR